MRLDRIDPQPNSIRAHIRHPRQGSAPDSLHTQRSNICFSLARGVRLGERTRAKDIGAVSSHTMYVAGERPLRRPTSAATARIRSAYESPEDSKNNGLKNVPSLRISWPFLRQAYHPESSGSSMPACIMARNGGRNSRDRRLADSSGCTERPVTWSELADRWPLSK